MNKIFGSLLIIALLGISSAYSRNVAALVSTDWLERNLREPGIFVLDIRTAAQFQSGHIPESLNTPLGDWAVSANGLTLELPSDEALRALLGKSGISESSNVVIVSRTETDFGRADATRVAWTCIVAGIQNVSVLDGGFTKWAREKRPISKEASVVSATTYSGTINRSSSVSKAHVLRRLNKLMIVDTREPKEYFGIISESGHIKNAVNLPTPWIFNEDGTFKNRDELGAMAAGVLGKEKSREIVVYCGVGGYASTWWYLLTQVLGYKNVKLFDGSFEEWVKDPAAPLQKYSWH